MWSPTKTLSNVSAPPTLKDRGPKRTARDPRSPLRIGANYAITSMGDIVALQCDGQSVAQQPQTKPHSNESTAPTLNPLRVDRAHSTRRTGLFALALGAWVLGAVPPPDHGAWWVGQVVGCAIHGSGLLLMGQKRLAK